MASRWYVLHVYSGYEKKIEARLTSLLEDPLFVQRVLSVRVPEKHVVERDSKGKKKDTLKKFLPGYVLLEMDIDQTNWKELVSAIRRIDGVTGFVGQQMGKPPVPISDEEARSILQKSGQISTSRIQKSWAVEFVEGEEVRIVDGPFDSFTGKIDEVVQEKGRLKVSVGIFGRNTPVELSFSQVEKL